MVKHVPEMVKHLQRWLSILSEMPRHHQWLVFVSSGGHERWPHGERGRHMLRVPAHPGPSLDARDDRGGGGYAGGSVGWRLEAEDKLERGDRGGVAALHNYLFL